MVTHFFCSQRIPGLKFQVHHAISPTTIQAYMTSLTLKSWSKVAPVLCPLWKSAGYESRYIPKAGKLLQGHKIASDQWNNIIIKTPTGDIILDCWIKTRDGQVTGVNFVCEAQDERAISVTALPKRNVNDLHVELGHPCETITWATAKALGIQVMDAFNHVKIAPWVMPSSEPLAIRLYIVQKF